MQLTLLNRKTLADIPSASGIEVIGENVYVMGDDSPWLFKLNKNLDIKEKIRISDIQTHSNNKIPKLLKPDLEAMTVLGTTILLFGSGSKSPERDVLITVNIDDSHTIKKYSLLHFYENLCNAAKLTRKELNIEAAVVLEENLYLFNRGKNRIFRLSSNAFMQHLENNLPIPLPEIFGVTLPTINGIEAGFSGATSIPGSQEIFFSASVEDTPNWIDDGEVAGSFVGFFSLNTIEDHFTPECIAVTDNEKNILKVKVESVAVQNRISHKSLHLLLVTDNDGETSELIECQFEY